MWFINADLYIGYSKENCGANFIQLPRLVRPLCPSVRVCGGQCPKRHGTLNALPRTLPQVHSLHKVYSSWYTNRLTKGHLAAGHACSKSTTGYAQMGMRARKAQRVTHRWTSQSRSQKDPHVNGLMCIDHPNAPSTKTTWHAQQPMTRKGMPGTWCGPRISRVWYGSTQMRKQCAKDLIEQRETKATTLTRDNHLCQTLQNDI